MSNGKRPENGLPMPSAHPTPQEDVDQRPAIQGSSPGSSLQSRIGSSASRLARDVFSGAPSSSTSGLASTWADAQKAGPSSAASASGDSSTWSQDRTRRGPTTNESHEAKSERFRSGLLTRDPLGSWIAEAALTADANAAAAAGQPGSWSQEFRSESEDLSYYHGQQPPLFQEQIRGDGSNGYSTEDGADVVALLNQPGSLFSGPSLAADINTAQRSAEETVADLFGEDQLSPSERDVSRQIRESLATDAPSAQEVATQPMPIPTSRSSSPESIRSRARFHPNVELLHLPLSTSPTATRRLSLSADSSRTYFSSHADREAWYRQWVEEWDDVLNNYQDAVWGVDEVPRVEEARRAVRDLKERDAKGEEWWNDAPPLRRLQQVLGHLGVEEGVKEPIAEHGQGDEMDQRFEGTWREQRRKGKQKAEPEEMQFRCSDCGGMYGADDHVMQHQRWEIQNAGNYPPGGSLGNEIGRQVRALQREKVSFQQSDW